MRKIYKIFMIPILICAISFVSYAADLNELQDQKNDELTDNLKQIQKLDESIGTTQEKLEELTKEISKKEEEILKIETELKTITQKYNTQKELLDARLIAMYETENTNYLDVVLGAKSISDFISSYYLIAEITSYDMDLLELVESQKKQIEEKNLQINNQREKLETEKSTAQRTEIALSNTKGITNHSDHIAR